MIDDVRPDAAQVAGDRFLRGCGIDRVERAVRIAEERDLAHAQLLRRGPQLRLARLADDVGARTLAAVAEPATLAARRRDEIRLDAFRRVFRQRPARPQRLVVGVGEDAHQSQSSFTA